MWEGCVLSKQITCRNVETDPVNKDCSFVSLIFFTEEGVEKHVVVFRSPPATLSWWFGFRFNHPCSFAVSKWEATH